MIVTVIDLSKPRKLFKNTIDDIMLHWKLKGYNTSLIVKTTTTVIVGVGVILLTSDVVNAFDNSIKVISAPPDNQMKKLIELPIKGAFHLYNFLETSGFDIDSKGIHFVIGSLF